VAHGSRPVRQAWAAVGQEDVGTSANNANVTGQGAGCNGQEPWKPEAWATRDRSYPAWDRRPLAAQSPEETRRCTAA
jgi:hypothetical protein